MRLLRGELPIYKIELSRGARIKWQKRNKFSLVRSRPAADTMYDGNSQLLIENPIDRYLINSPMLPGMTFRRIAARPRKLTGCPRPTTPSI
jgi:hypothetical protein